MSKVICPDIIGQLHEVDESELIDTVRAYGVCIQDNAVLMVQDSGSKGWEIPGGGVEFGESAEEGVKREFIEETGLAISGPLQLIDRFTELFYARTEKKAWRADRHFFLVQSVSGKPLEKGNQDDTVEVRFVPLAELSSLTIKPQIRRVLEKSQKFIEI